MLACMRRHPAGSNGHPPFWPPSTGATFFGILCRMKTPLFCTLAVLCTLASAKEPVDYIDPLIGTEGKGSQYGGMMPMTGVPFGSIQWVPMTRLTEVGALSYN